MAKCENIFLMCEKLLLIFLLPGSGPGKSVKDLFSINIFFKSGNEIFHFSEGKFFCHSKRILSGGEG